MLGLESENEVFDGGTGRKEEGTSESEGEIGTAQSEMDEVEGNEKRHGIAETTESLRKVSKKAMFSCFMQSIDILQ